MSKSFMTMSPDLAPPPKKVQRIPGHFVDKAHNFSHH